MDALALRELVAADWRALRDVRYEGVWRGLAPVLTLHGPSSGTGARIPLRDG
jgi:hypothetical protein